MALPSLTPHFNEAIWYWEWYKHAYMMGPGVLGIVADEEVLLCAGHLVSALDGVTRALNCYARSCGEQPLLHVLKMAV
jgi:hypothetical protein